MNAKEGSFADFRSCKARQAEIISKRLCQERVFTHLGSNYAMTEAFVELFPDGASMVDLVDAKIGKTWGG